MAIALKIKDASTAGDVHHESTLEIPTERISVRELIRERVYQEVQDFNRNDAQQVFRGLVQPTDTERVLNGRTAEYRMKKHRDIDWKEQFDKALEAFEHNGFLILVGERQAESLDQELTVTAGTEVSFVRLTMLVGG